MGSGADGAFMQVAFHSGPQRHRDAMGGRARHGPRTCRRDYRQRNCVAPYVN